MLRTNLATRPFYNERLTGLVFGVLAVLVAVATVLNVVWLVSLSGRDAALRQEAQETTARAADLRREAQAARARVDRKELLAVSAAAKEANALIDGRTFSWTELFNRFEETLPRGVRITAVHPSREQESGRFSVTIDVEAREVDEVEAFMDALEARGGFREVLARREQVDDEGLVVVSVTGFYASSALQVEETGGTR
jgi:hypothetical protein